MAPWESFYVQEGVTNGFGEPTFRMRERLRQAGPRGVEREQPVRRSYRYRASLLQRACSAGGLGRPAGTEEAALLESFVEIDLLPWLGRFTTALYEEGATYYGLLADLAEGLLGVVRAFSPSASTCAA